MLIILEGASTVGKTMVQKALANILSKKQIKYRIIDQNEGLPPETFSHLDPKKSREFLNGYLKENCQNPDTIYIFDRLHLSHFAITNGSTEDVEQIETELLKYNTLLVLLVIDEEKIKDRIEGAIKYRGDQWIENLALHGDTRDDQAKWHARTQKKHANQYEMNKLPKVIYNTTNSNFSEIAQQIFEKYIQK